MYYVTIMLQNFSSASAIQKYSFDFRYLSLGVILEIVISLLGTHVRLFYYRGKGEIYITISQQIIFLDCRPDVLCDMSVREKKLESDSSEQPLSTAAHTALPPHRRPSARHRLTQR